MLATPLDAAILVAILTLLPLWLIKRHFDQLQNPRYLRRRPIVTERASVLETPAAPIGEYFGLPIAEAVVFKGLRYRFDHVLEPRNRHRIRPGQLYLEPGLVYVVEQEKP